MLVDYLLTANFHLSTTTYLVLLHLALYAETIPSKFEDPIAIRSSSGS